MLVVLTLALTGLVAASSSSSSSSSSSKRGLVFVPSEDHPSDNALWVQPGSLLTWYYNYEAIPSPAFSSVPQSRFEFVPMMWGVDPENPSDTQFLTQVTDLLDSGTNVSHVLAFNEPDAPSEWGGSNLEPAIAAKAWVANFEPLARRGVRLGLPACTGGWGSMPWLRQFLGNCSEIVSRGHDDGEARRNCTWDFLPVHWYDNLEGLKSHVNERRDEWPGVEIWVTEYALAHQPLAATQTFYNDSAAWLDDSDFVGRYSYFGAFRSADSNVGPEAVFLSDGGELTDLGAWYLGEDPTGVDPQSGSGVARGRRVGRGVVVGVVGGLMLGLAMV
ncbi:hypothetical protein ACO1O0_004769 [Amphichorda felina]